MAVIQIALVVLLSGLVSTVLSYDKDIKVADLSACSEVIFDEGAKYFVTQHIDRFKYNTARPDEWLRMRMYYMGADGPHIGFSEKARLDEDRSLILGIGYPIYNQSNFYMRHANYLSKTDQRKTIHHTSNIFHKIFFSQLDVMFTRDGELTVTTPGEPFPFATFKSNNDFKDLYVHFAVMKGENGRILYDCPHGFSFSNQNHRQPMETNLVIRLKLDGVGIKKASPDIDYGNVYVGDNEGLDDDDSRKMSS